MKVTAALMLKAPRPGTVKTRLAREIGNEWATAIYVSLVEQQVAQIPAHWRCAIHFAPADAEMEMRAWLGLRASGDAAFRAQCDGDLGARMRHVVRTELADGADAVVLLGGDCPDLDSDVLCDAEARLVAADGVIAPALDGGYVLLGVKADHPELFEGIAWSTGEVFSKTEAAARRGGLGLSIMETYSDVDDLDSLRAAFPQTQA